MDLGQPQDCGGFWATLMPGIRGGVKFRDSSSGPLNHPLRMEPAPWILVWLAAILESLSSFHPFISFGAGFFSPIPSYPKRLSRIWPYMADVWERTSWLLEGKLFSSPYHKWAASLPCAARCRVFWLRDWDEPHTAEPHSWGTVQVNWGLGRLVVVAEWSRVGRNWWEIPFSVTSGKVKFNYS